MSKCKVEYCDYGGKKIIWYNENGLIENLEDKPAEIIIYSHGIRKYWYRNGKLHREEDKPAEQFYIKENNVWYKRAERWYNNGTIHRDNDKPALIIYYINGNVDNEIWYIYGKKTRITFDNPSEIQYNKNTSKKFEAYSDTSGKIYRENGPSLVHYDYNGIKVRELWFTERMLHRLDGPADIEYKDDKISNIKYYLFNKHLTEFGYIRLLYILRRKIWRYKTKKRNELLDKIKTTKFYENKSDICKMITTYVY